LTTRADWREHMKTGHDEAGFECVLRSSLVSFGCDCLRLSKCGGSSAKTHSDLPLPPPCHL
jgi:hypothetical protein